MNKFKIFREMLDYLNNICDVTDADMNYCFGDMRITGETEGQKITIEISIREKEEKENGN